MTDYPAIPPVFTPDNEPYLGRQSVYLLDLHIVECLRLSGEIAPRTHCMDKSDLHLAACHLVPQALSLSLSIRELVRQGYLFGALNLLRPLLERIIILYYLHAHPEAMDKWKRGWQHNEAPSLARMMSDLGQEHWKNIGPAITGPLNGVLHGKPESAIWTTVQIGADQWGQLPSKMLNDPALCDKICMETDSLLLMLQIMMDIIFPQQDTPTSCTPAI